MMAGIIVNTSTKGIRTFLEPPNIFLRLNYSVKNIFMKIYLRHSSQNKLSITLGGSNEVKILFVFVMIIIPTTVTHFDC
jgi:hypothetical protein